MECAGWCRLVGLSGEYIDENGLQHRVRWVVVDFQNEDSEGHRYRQKLEGFFTFASVIKWMASWSIHAASRQVRATAIHLIYGLL